MLTGDRRILILSDTHLGRDRSAAHSVAALRPLWRDATHVVMNGDVVEIQDERHWSHAARALIELRDATDADDVELILLSGNHDPFLTSRRHLLLAGGSVLVTHGDAMHPSVAPWSPAAPRMRQVHDTMLASLSDNDINDLTKQLHIAQHASHAEWDTSLGACRHSSIIDMMRRPWAALRVLSYWRRFPSLAASFAARYVPEAQYIITGHTHRQGIWTSQGRTVINTGCYGFPGRPRAVTIDDAGLRVWSVNTSDHRAYAFDASVIDAFPIDIQSLRLPSAEKTRLGSDLPRREAI